MMTQPEWELKKDQMKGYLKDNLKLDWQYDGNKLYLALKLEGETVTRLRFHEV